NATTAAATEARAANNPPAPIGASSKPSHSGSGSSATTSYEKLFDGTWRNDGSRPETGADVRHSPSKLRQAPRPTPQASAALLRRQDQRRPVRRRTSPHHRP